jgi:hypothetical protein
MGKGIVTNIGKEITIAETVVHYQAYVSGDDYEFHMEHIYVPLDIFDDYDMIPITAFSQKIQDIVHKAIEDDLQDNFLDYYGELCEGDH